MLLLMVDEPLVIVVKLADRLHNMRTAYALAPNKRCAVATETLEVWCTLAERLGMFAIKVGLSPPPPPPRVAPHHSISHLEPKLAVELCSSGNQLRVFAMQSELEDLCFAVLHPECYRKLHAARNELWKRNVVSPSVAEEADRVLDSYDGDTGNKVGRSSPHAPIRRGTAEQSRTCLLKCIVQHRSSCGTGKWCNADTYFMLGI